MSDIRDSNNIGYNHFPEGGAFPSPNKLVGIYPHIDHLIDLQHPWLTNLKVMAEWLESNAPLPHGRLDTDDLQYKGSQANSNKAWYRAEPTVFFRSTCEHCILMFKLRFEYQNNHDRTGTHQSST